MKTKSSWSIASYLILLLWVLFTLLPLYWLLSSTFKQVKIKITPDEVNSFVENIIKKYIKSSKKYIGLFLKDLINGDEFTTYKLK